MPDAPTPLDLDAIRQRAAQGYPGLGLWAACNDALILIHEVEHLRAALAAALPLLTAAPSATREDVARAIRSVTDLWDEPLDEAHDVPPIADALLARFTITPKEDR